MTEWPPISFRVQVLPHSLCTTVSSRLPRPSTMDPKISKRQKRQENAISLLNVAIEALNLAKEVSSATPAKAVFGSVSVLLTMIKVRFLPFSVTHPKLTCNQESMANKIDYVELGIACADVCKALHRGMNGRGLDDLNESVREAINQLTE